MYLGFGSSIIKRKCLNISMVQNLFGALFINTTTCLQLRRSCLLLLIFKLHSIPYTQKCPVLNTYPIRESCDRVYLYFLFYSLIVGCRCRHSQLLIQKKMTLPMIRNLMCLAFHPSQKKELKKKQCRLRQPRAHWQKPGE